MDKVGGQDVRNGAISIRASSGMRGCHRKRGCVFLFFQAEDISQPHIDSAACR